MTRQGCQIASAPKAFRPEAIPLGIVCSIWQPRKCRNRSDREVRDRGGGVAVSLTSHLRNEYKTLKAREFELHKERNTREAEFGLDKIFNIKS